MSSHSRSKTPNLHLTRIRRVSLELYFFSISLFNSTLRLLDAFPVVLASIANRRICMNKLILRPSFCFCYVLFFFCESRCNIQNHLNTDRDLLSHDRTKKRTGFTVHFHTDSSSFCCHFIPFPHPSFEISPTSNKTEGEALKVFNYEFLVKYFRSNWLVAVVITSQPCARYITRAGGRCGGSACCCCWWWQTKIIDKKFIYLLSSVYPYSSSPSFYATIKAVGPQLGPPPTSQM